RLDRADPGRIRGDFGRGSRDAGLEVAAHEWGHHRGRRGLDVGLDDGLRLPGLEREWAGRLEAARVGEVLGGEAELLLPLLALEGAGEVAQRRTRGTRQLAEQLLDAHRVRVTGAGVQGVGPDRQTLRGSQ